MSRSSMSGSSSMHSAKPMHHNRSAMRTGRGDPQGDRAVTALNTLMSAGYESYSDFRADGQNFSANASRDGRIQRVTINPETRSVMPNG